MMHINSVNTDHDPSFIPKLLRIFTLKLWIFRFRDVHIKGRISNLPHKNKSSSFFAVPITQKEEKKYLGRVGSREGVEGGGVGRGETRRLHRRDNGGRFRS
jgi:hypothetical protein